MIHLQTKQKLKVITKHIMCLMRMIIQQKYTRKNSLIKYFHKKKNQQIEGKRRKILEIKDDASSLSMEWETELLKLSCANYWNVVIRKIFIRTPLFKSMDMGLLWLLSDC